MTQEDENIPSDQEEATETSAEMTAEPVLNRAQRRAMAKGKKGANPTSGLQHGQNARFGPRDPNARVQSNLPRSGHR